MSNNNNNLNGKNNEKNDQIPKPKIGKQLSHSKNVLFLVLTNNSFGFEQTYIQSFLNIASKRETIGNENKMLSILIHDLALGKFQKQKFDDNKVIQTQTKQQQHQNHLLQVDY